jgi:hypothetical protein
MRNTAILLNHFKALRGFCHPSHPGAPGYILEVAALPFKNFNLFHIIESSHEKMPGVSEGMDMNQKNDRFVCEICGKTFPSGERKILR